MRDVRRMSDRELAIRCTRRYTEEEMQDSIKASEEQIRNGQFIVYDDKYADNLKKRYCIK